MRHFLEHTTFEVGRCSFLLRTAGTLAVGLWASLTRPKISEAHAAPLPPLKPISGGIDVSPLIHIFVPGPETITLPFSGFILQGLNVEPSTITDFLGSDAAVPPTDPAAFLGSFARARSTAHFSGRQLGFSFRSDPGASSDRGYAEIGTERNGLFL